MFNNGFEKLGLVLVGAYVAFNEWRHKNSVSAKRFEDHQRVSEKHLGRIESHIWDIAQAQHIQLTREVPDEIKNQR